MNRKIIWEKWNDSEPEPKEEGDNSPTLFSPVIYLVQKLFSGMKNQKFYVGTTNFDITEVEALIIDQTPGVEIFNVLSRYKFRFSPAKTFRASEVRQTIELLLGCENKYSMNESQLAYLKATRLQLENEGMPWIIFILPNGKFEYYQNKNKNQFEETLARYREAEQLIPGFVITSGV